MRARTPVCTRCELHMESTFVVEGLDCREEVLILERRFRNLAGLEDFTTDLVGRRLFVKYDAAKLTASAIAGAVADTGMRAWLEHEEPIAMTDDAARRRRFLVCASGLCFVAGLGLELLAAPSWASRSVFGLSIAAGIGLTGPRAWKAVRVRAFDINALMIIAVTGAVMLGQWAEAAAVICLFALAQALEARTLERARGAISGLLDLTPAAALVRDPAGDRRVEVDRIPPGACIVVHPGEKIPLDGVVVAGESAINQAPVTGESLPVDTRAGDEVFAGTINGRGALEVRVTRVRRDTTLARIIHLVEQAQAQRAPSQALVERFARIYTPAVIVLAAALALGPPLALGGSWHTWLYRALVLLVVSCPCALVISTPVSIVAALAGAARRGVLIKGGIHLERTGRVRCVAFDKTGTLTRGKPEVVDVISLDGAHPQAVVALAAAVERRSEHPIAQAILRFAASSGIVVWPGEGVQALSGLGAEGLVGGERVILGNHRLFEERGLCSPAIQGRLDEVSRSGRTAVLVARAGRPIGIIAVADRPREAAKDAVDLLRHQGIEFVAMLTGDNHATAQAIAREVGVDDVRAELLPEDKVAAVADLRRRFGTVAMVGDGVNDAPALASADVGIAMGAAGSDTALETADVALMGDELLKIPFALRLSHATLRNIKANFAISLVTKAAFVVAAVWGAATLWMAVLADTGASILVIANALRLLRRS